ncbi:MAG: hypothetical protein Q8Q71_09170 [Brevundimonas sp.]|nr:hypothetical protein [Brevundimonas sp.]
MPLTPSRRLYARQTYGRAADAFDAVAWRPPEPRRFDSRVANDPVVPEPTLKELAADLPGWVTVVAGGAVAALMGALLGGALAL